MKRILSILLALIISTNTLVIGCYAANAEDIAQTASTNTLVDDYLSREDAPVSSQALATSVQADLSLLKVSYLDSLVSISDVDNRGRVTYQIAYDGIVDYISVSNNANGDVVLKVWENDLYNELVYAKDGSVLLDGKPAYEATVTTPIASTDSDSNIGTQITRAGPRSQLFAISLPNGKASIPSNYKFSSGKWGDPFSLSKALASIAISVLISLTVNAALGVAISLIGLGSAIISSILTEALSMSSSQIAALQKASPNSKKLQYYMEVYAKNGNDSLRSDFIYLFQLFGEAGPTGPKVYAGAKKIIEST